MSHGAILERGVLFHAVWNQPVSKVAARHGISGVALAKACRKMGIPLPPRGY